MIKIKDYMEVMYNAVNGIVDAVYLKDRPQAVSDKINNFAVVDVSSYVNNKELNPSGNLNHYTAQVYISIFIRDKVTNKRLMQVDIVKMDELIQSTFEKFPIKDEEKSVYIHKPRVMISASDEDGWHYTLISASLQTYF